MTVTVVWIIAVLFVPVGIGHLAPGQFGPAIVRFVSPAWVGAGEYSRLRSR